MRAVWLRAFGGPEQLRVEDTRDPEPESGQALIDVELANVTFVETMFRATGFGPERELPVIPGNGVGGRVVAVGPDVDASLVGTRVVSSTGGTGAYAERVAVDAAGVFRVPDMLALDGALALLADGRTATMLVDVAAVGPGDRVLVEAAAGGVGTLLVQLARRAGALVVGAAGGPRKTGVVRRLGADVVVDYLDADWADRVRAGAGGLDVVFDGVGGATARAAFELLERGGRMVSFGLASGEWAGIADATAAERGVTLVSTDVLPDQLRAYTERALAEAAAGRLHPVIGQRFPLARAADAHAAIEARATVGKTLLVVR